MPIYEFKCQCGKIFEEICAINTSEYYCPNCNLLAKKIPSTSQFIVNGYNEKNGYSRSSKQQFIKDGPVDSERRLKRDGKQTAHDVLNK